MIQNGERLFAAINFSNEFKKSLLKTQQNIKERLQSGNFSRKDNLHLTLAFIGQTKRRAAAVAAMSKISAPQFEICLSRVGSFGRGLYFAGLEQSPSLVSLASEVTSALQDEGFLLDSRSFSPHITLVRNGITTDGGKIPALLCPEHCKMTVKSFELMKSTVINGVLTYIPLKSFPLKPIL